MNNHKIAVVVVFSTSEIGQLRKDWIIKDLIIIIKSRNAQLVESCAFYFEKIAGVGQWLVH